MPTALTPAYGASTFSATGTVSVNFGSNADRGLFGVVFFSNNVNPNTANVTSVVIDPAGANISCTLGARRAGSPTLGSPGILYSFWANGSGMPTGTVDVVVTSDTTNGQPRIVCLPLEDAVTISSEAVSSGLNLVPSVSIASATGSKVFGILSTFLADGQSISPAAPATQIDRILEADAAQFVGAIWLEDGASFVLMNGTITGATPAWAMTAVSVQGAVSVTPVTATLNGALSSITGNVSSVPLTPTATLAGALNSITGPVSTGAVQGRLTSALPLRDAARVVLANRSDVVVHVMTLADLVSVALLSGQSITSGIWTASGAFAPGTSYAVMYSVGGTRIGCEIITATVV